MEIFIFPWYFTIFLSERRCGGKIPVRITHCNSPKSPTNIIFFFHSGTPSGHVPSCPYPSHFSSGLSSSTHTPSGIRSILLTHFVQSFSLTPSKTQRPQLRCKQSNHFEVPFFSPLHSAGYASRVF